MIFSTRPTAEAEGLVRAQALRCNRALFHKDCHLSTADPAALAAERIRAVSGARLDHNDIDDIDENIAVLILAAGRATRMGKNKLLLPIDGVPMIEHVADAALNSAAKSIVVVTGHDAATIGKLLLGRGPTIVHNADYKSGMASSLRRGLHALPADVDAVLVMLGDMPHITASHVDRLIHAYRDDPTAIYVPHCQGQPGNPVLWPRRYFERILQVRGDTGARILLNEHADCVTAVEFDDPAILMDIDTPRDYSATALTANAPAINAAPIS